jgi:hypothetical protein
MLRLFQNGDPITEVIGKIVFLCFPIVTPLTVMFIFWASHIAISTWICTWYSGWWSGTFFPHIGNNHPNRLSYFLAG